MDRFGRDLPDCSPKVPIPLSVAGVSGLTGYMTFAPIFHGDAERVVLLCQAELSVSLGSERRGVHISRFTEAFTEVARERLPFIEAARHLAKSIAETQQETTSRVRLQADHILQRKTTETGRTTIVPVTIGVETKLASSGEIVDVFLSADTIAVCPCCLEMRRSLSSATEQGNRESEEGTLSSHSQRARIRVSVSSSSPPSHQVLLAAVEGCTPLLGSTLKRPDELALVESAFSEPRFAEDLCREALFSLRAHVEDPSSGSTASVRVRSQDSIHPFDVVAEGSIDLSADTTNSSYRSWH